MTRTTPVVRSLGVGARPAWARPAARAGRPGRGPGWRRAATLAPSGSEVVLATDGAGSAVVAWVAGGQVQVPGARRECRPGTG